jgi:hypothetical protein
MPGLDLGDGVYPRPPIPHPQSTPLPRASQAVRRRMTARHSFFFSNAISVDPNEVPTEPPCRYAFVSSNSAIEPKKRQSCKGKQCLDLGNTNASKKQKTVKTRRSLFFA